MEREEILKSLNNRPIKLHEPGKLSYGQSNAYLAEENQSRSKDIKLENIGMTLTSLELLTDVNVVFAHGHKYGEIVD